MASSLSPQCTPLKHAYDKCFNSWFEGYLQPAIEESQPSNASSTSTSRNTGNGISEEETRRAYSKRKAQEFEEKCGKVWESYRACISVSVSHLIPFCNYSFRFCVILEAIINSLMPSQKAVTEKGLDTLLDQARRENPLRDPEPAVPPPNVSKYAAPPSSV